MSGVTDAIVIQNADIHMYKCSYLSQVGFYIGFTESWLSLASRSSGTDDKVIRYDTSHCIRKQCQNTIMILYCRVLTSLQHKLREFQILNTGSPEYSTTLSLLRAKFKQASYLVMVWDLARYTCMYYCH